LLGLLYEGSHLSLSVWRKITVNVFYSTFTNGFLFLSGFYVFNVFFILGERFFIYGMYAHVSHNYNTLIKTVVISTQKCNYDYYLRHTNRLPFAAAAYFEKSNQSRIWAHAQHDGRPRKVAASVENDEWRKFRNSIPCTTPQSLDDAHCSSAVQ